MAGAFRDVPEREIPDAGSTTRIVQQVGGSFGAAVLAAILTHALLGQGTVTDAFCASFRWAIGLTVLALLPAFLLPARKPCQLVRSRIWRRPSGPHHALSGQWSSLGHEKGGYSSRESTDPPRRAFWAPLPPRGVFSQVKTGIAGVCQKRA
jgi:hypothetical protein